VKRKHITGVNITKYGPYINQLNAKDFPSKETEWTKPQRNQSSRNKRKHT
jgi:hypothetical protein